MPPSSLVSSEEVEISTPVPDVKLWEVLTVTATPILFIVFLCFCVIYMAIRRWERADAVVVEAPVTRASLHPPPPDYIRVCSLDPPPVYSPPDLKSSAPQRPLSLNAADLTPSSSPESPRRFFDFSPPSYSIACGNNPSAGSSVALQL